MSRALLSDNGVDTIRLRWREDNVAHVNFKRREGGTREGYRGERFVQTPFGRVGSYPDGLFYIESRAGALAVADPDDHRLAKIEDLPTAERVARSIMHNVGAEISNDPARLGRVDLASEMRFADPAEGSAFLHSLASLDVPWCKTRVDGRKGSQIETVSFHGTSGKTIYLRAYDKGVESGSDRAGKRIRVERQKRFRKTREPNLEQLIETTDFRSMFYGREFSKLVNLPAATVCDVRGALDTLCERSTNYSQLERLAGYIVVGAMIDYSRPTSYRRSAELRQLGIYVDPGATVERIEVPVGRYLETLGSAWAA